ncbi:MAG: hypothetical protein KW793_03600 [Candidatus Doudnabacteria bacterium]|nr:hypothetical protein [Candidatus Doudnabacteria bacterium]
MATTTTRGNYYKRRTKDFFEKQGYTVQLTEFMCATVIKGRCFYRKIDILGSDGIAMKEDEIIFWNSKHCTTDDKNNIDTQIRQAKKEFGKYPFPNFVKRQVVFWKPHKQPIIIDCK